MTLVRRIDGSKTPVGIGDVVGEVTAALEADQRALYDEASARLQDRTQDVKTLADAIEAAGSGWARVPWDKVGEAGETKANEVGVSVRCLTRADGSVPDSDTEQGLVAYLARAY